jgi:thiol-disulfide isomerase/thioredoxin
VSSCPPYLYSLYKNYVGPSDIGVYTGVGETHIGLPVSRETVLASMNEVLKNGQRDVDVDFVNQWCDNVKSVLCEMESLASELGFEVVRNSFCCTPDELWQMATENAKSSSPGPWRSCCAQMLGISTHEVKTQKELVAVVNARKLEGDKAAQGFIDLYWNVAREFIENRDPTIVPLVIFGKDEPISIAKAMQGRHRKITMPDWTVRTVEEFLYHFRLDGKRYSVDSVYGVINKNYGTNSVMGLNCSSSFIRAKFHNFRKKYCYDIRGWEMCVPHQVMGAIYAFTLGHIPGLPEVWHQGLNGRGIYIVGSELFRLPPNHWLWCSGVRLTLFGNTVMHQGLLKTMGIDGVAQGDDAVFAADPNFVGSQLARAGLQAKEFHSDADFCKMKLKHDSVNFDLPDIADKMSLRRSKPDDQVISYLIMSKCNLLAGASAPVPRFIMSLPRLMILLLAYGLDVISVDGEDFFVLVGADSAASLQFTAGATA